MNTKKVKKHYNYYNFKINRIIEKHGNFDTDLYNFLKLIPDNILFYKEHNLRHPLAIYHLSSSRVFEAFKKTYNEFKNLNAYYNQSFRNTKNIEKLSKNLTELLNSLMSFIDDGYHLMKCLYPIKLVRKKIIYADKWLEQVDKKIIDDYKKKISIYKDKLSIIVNKIKHQHARIRFIEFKTKKGNILGYFIEGVGANGIICPDPEIHQKFLNMDTAFSFNRELKYHLCYFYFIAKNIKDTLEDIIIKNGLRTFKLIKAKETFNINKNILEICCKISSLPNLFFFDEYNKGIPEIKINSKRNNLEFIFPSQIYIDETFENFKITLLTKSNGVSKTYQLPYFKPKFQ